MPARGLHAHTRLRRLNGKRGENLAVAADDRHRRTDHADQVFLAVERDLLFADLPQFGVEPRAIGDGAVGEAAQLEALQQAAAARRGGKRQEQLADRAARN